MDLDWGQEPEEVAADHSARAARVCERLEARGAMVMDAHLEDWVYRGRVNVSPRPWMTPYWHKRYTRRVVIVACSPGTTGTGDIAIDLEVERLGNNGAVRDGEMRIRAPHAHELCAGVHWRENRKDYTARGYSRGERVIDVLTEVPDAGAARRAL